MDNRIPITKLSAAFLAGMEVLDKAISETGINPWHIEMIKLRASYINGCAYCVVKHTQDALNLGVGHRKIAVIPVWREAMSHFTNEEHLILRLTEQVSYIHIEGIGDDLYAQCIQTFGEEMTGNLIGAAIHINSWNRIGVGLKMEPTV